MATQAERRERTRSAIVGAATELFASRGFAETTIADVLAEAGVSRGALYHHFDSKEDLFAEVYGKVSAEAVDRAGRSQRSTDAPLDALIGACLAWLDITIEDTVATILFVEGPKAIGWDRCRSIEEAASFGRVRAGLTLAARAGDIAATDLDLTARLINAAVAEAALAVHQRRPGASRAAARRTLTALIAGLVNSSPETPSD